MLFYFIFIYVLFMNCCLAFVCYVLYLLGGLCVFVTLDSSYSVLFIYVFVAMLLQFKLFVCFSCLICVWLCLLGLLVCCLLFVVVVDVFKCMCIYTYI